EDLDRQVLALLAEHLSPLPLHNRACSVVRIHHLVADLVQARPFPSFCDREAGGWFRRPRRTSLAKAAGNRLFLGKSLLTADFPDDPAEDRRAGRQDHRDGTKEEEPAPQARRARDGPDQRWAG